MTATFDYIIIGAWFGGLYIGAQRRQCDQKREPNEARVVLEHDLRNSCLAICNGTRLDVFHDSCAVGKRMCLHAKTLEHGQE